MYLALPIIKNSIKRQWMRKSRYYATAVSFYDSQSGQQISYIDKIHAHGLLNKPYQSDMKLGNLDTLTLSKAEFHTPELKKMFQDKKIYDPSMSTCNLAIDISCSSPRETWGNIINECMNATKHGVSIKASLLDAFTSDINDVQLVSSLLADAGVSLIVLDDTSATTDDNSLLEYFEAMSWTDIEGIPMKQRICLRLNPTSNSLEELLVQAAEELEIQHFDVCHEGITAPKISTLVEVLDRAGIEHELH